MREKRSFLPVVNLLDFPARALVVVQPDARGLHQTVAQLRSLRVLRSCSKLLYGDTDT